MGVAMPQWRAGCQSLTAQCGPSYNRPMQLRRQWTGGLVALVLWAQAGWAAPLSGTVEGFGTSNPIPDWERAFHRSTLLFQGATTTGGALRCTGELVHLFYPVPSGVCGADATEAAFSYAYYCQDEGTPDLFHAWSYGTACYDNATCYAGQVFPQVGCTYTFTEHVEATEGVGIAAESQGTWETVGHGTVTQVQPSYVPDLFFVAYTFSATWDGALNRGEATPLAPAGAHLEIPAPGTTVSGVGVVSGWSCLGGELAVEFSDSAGVILTQTVLQGSERTDTAGVCGDIDNGFSSLINWSLLGTGERTARLIRNGEEVAAQTFYVQAFDQGFVTGAEGRCTMPDFPEAGKNATFVWEESQQGVVLGGVEDNNQDTGN